MQGYENMGCIVLWYHLSGLDQDPESPFVTEIGATVLVAMDV